MYSESSEFYEMLKMIAEIYQDHMPFNRLLNIRVDVVEPSSFQVRVDMREELVGNFVKGILHGGVISSILDLTGGLIASADVLKQMQGSSSEDITDRFARMGTIDLRVDYLRVGRGKYFVATGSTLRTGNRVAVIHTEFRNDENSLIAVGTGTYIVG